MLYFTSDLHLGHWRIANYCHRPFRSLKHMDTVLIDNINSRVKENDTLFHLGDFCFSKSSEAVEAPRKAFDYYRSQLNCKNIIFVLGNHDHHNHIKSWILSCQIKHGGKFINMCHNPENANPIYELNLHGHIHEKGKIQEKMIGVSTTTLVNVGVDVWNFRPITYSEIISAVIKYKKDLTSST